MNTKNKVMKIKCPQCATSFNYYDKPTRPFCSERCKAIDLGHWFDESYAVPGEHADLERAYDEENDTKY